VTFLAVSRHHQSMWMLLTGATGPDRRSAATHTHRIKVSEAVSADRGASPGCGPTTFPIGYLALNLRWRPMSRQRKGDGATPWRRGHRPVGSHVKRDLLRVGQVRGEEIVATSPAGKPPEGPPPFDPNVTSARDLRDQPLSVIKTELPALADALGVTPAELFRSLTGPTGQPESSSEVQGRLAGLADMQATDLAAMCCHSDSW
jgi:hypothetical protein